MTYSAIVIPANPEIPLRRITVGGRADLHAAVGGYVEARDYHADPTITAYCHEEAKFVAMPAINRRATRWLGPGLFAGDYVADDVVVCGFTQGQNRDCPDNFEEMITSAGRPLPEPTALAAEPRTLRLAWDLRMRDPSGRRLAVLTITHRDTPLLSYFSASLDNMHLKDRHHAVAAKRAPRDADPFVVHTGQRQPTGAYLLVLEPGQYATEKLDAFTHNAVARLLALYHASAPGITRYFATANGGAL